MGLVKTYLPRGYGVCSGCRAAPSARATARTRNTCHGKHFQFANVMLRPRPNLKAYGRPGGPTVFGAVPW